MVRCTSVTMSSSQQPYVGRGHAIRIRDTPHTAGSTALQRSRRGGWHHLDLGAHDPAVTGGTQGDVRGGGGLVLRMTRSSWGALRVVRGWCTQAPKVGQTWPSARPSWLSP